jgi:hypothetical protein
MDMYRRKVILTGLAVFAIGVAFAAQSTSDRFDRGRERSQQVSPWVPGANMLMSAHEANIGPLAPPR